MNLGSSKGFICDVAKKVYFPVWARYVTIFSLPFGIVCIANKCFLWEEESNIEFVIVYHRL